jgi:protein gp37
MAKSKIEWTDEVWNPLAGCSIVSAGCKNCYAMRMAYRLSAMGQAKYHGLTKKVNGNVVWTGKVFKDYDALATPRHWNKRRRIFVNSMSDLFHENVPDDFIQDVFDVMRYTPRHTYQILTKRPARMAKLVRKISGGDYPVAANIWLGVSVEDQAAANERIPLLLQTPAAVRFLSCEPLLGPLNLHWLGLLSIYDTCSFNARTNRRYYLDSNIPMLDWVICGGESGPGARPMHPDWARGLRDQCQEAGVPFFFKQWGEWLPIREGDEEVAHDFYRAEDANRLRRGIDLIQHIGHFVVMERVGKAKAGRLLDGRTWDEMPAVRA